MKWIYIIIFLILILWNFLTSGYFNFWTDVLFIYAIWNYENIFRLLIKAWNLYLRQYNTAYPVYTRFDIGSDWNKIVDANYKSAKSHDKYVNQLDKEHKKGIKRNRDFSEKLKGYYKDYLAAGFEKDFWLEIVNYKIEANISVNNGKKKIKEVTREFFGDYKWRQDIENSKDYKEWINYEAKK